MINNLNKLHQLLISNNYLDAAEKVEEIIEGIQLEEKESFKHRLVLMCHPKYLGDYYISEFDSVYDWWNFSEEIKKEVESL